MKKIAVFTALLFGVAFTSEAQLQDRPVSTNPVARVLSTSHFEYDNNWAIGAKVGEPLALNIRKYFAQGRHSFDLNIGTYGFILGRNKTYRGNTIYNTSGTMIQGIHNWNRSIGTNNRVNAYYGFGGQINSRREYGTLNQNGRAVSRMSLGPAIQVGLEYNIPDTQLGAFVDAGGYAELLPRPLLIQPQISGGVRLNLVR